VDLRHAEAPAVPLDGEITILDLPLHYRSRSEALRVMVPQAA
jgi:hypothetical protein